MKTTFGRLFTVTAVTVLAAIVLMGVSFWGLVRGYLLQEQEAELTANAESVAALASDYATAYAMYQLAPYVDAELNLSMNLAYAAKVSGTDALLCSLEGQVLLCSCQEPVCSHVGSFLGKDYVNQTVEAGGDFRVETLSGIYEGKRYCAAKTFAVGEQTVGLVVVSETTQGTAGILAQITEMFIMVALIALMLAVISISIYTRNQTKPLKEMADAARAFGHGDLRARVQTGGKHTEEIDDLAVAFNNMASSLEQSEYQRQEFVANVSHELKTPMTTIGGYVDGILDETIPPERREHYLGLVSQEIRRLSRLVRSMLEISRLQNQGFPREQMHRFDVTECVGQVLISFEQKINGKGLDVEVDFPEYPVYALGVLDPITQVVYNLIDNGVKFSPEGGSLGLRIREGGSKVYVSVSNTGPCIPPEELPLVFDRFHKIDKSRSQNRDGWGLGLYIVKTIVCSHGEDISVTSRDGKTEFTFTLTKVHSL